MTLIIQVLAEKAGGWNVCVTDQSNGKHVWTRKAKSMTTLRAALGKAAQLRDRGQFAPKRKKKPAKPSTKPMVEPGPTTHDLEVFRDVP